MSLSKGVIIDGVTAVEGAPFLYLDSDEPIQVWTDGSYGPVKQGKRRGGAAAVIPGDDNSGLWLLSTHLLPGPGTNSGIAEWTAVNMALWAIWSLRYDFAIAKLDRPSGIHRPIQVFTDSRDLVDAVANRTVNAVSKDARYESLTLPEQGGRQDTAHRARRKTSTQPTLERQNATVSVEWVKAHSGLELNDLADQLAKAERDPDGKAAQAGAVYFGRPEDWPVLHTRYVNVEADATSKRSGGAKMMAGTRVLGCASA